MKILALAIASLALSASAVMAQMNDSTMDHSNMEMSHEALDGAVHTNAVINSIGNGTANVSHDPIPEIGWPAMTMDMPLSNDAQMMGEAGPGDSVILMLIKGDDGMYQIGAIMPQ